LLKSLTIYISAYSGTALVFFFAVVLYWLVLSPIGLTPLYRTRGTADHLTLTPAS
jgi:hypothetical protein